MSGRTRNRRALLLAGLLVACEAKDTGVAPAPPPPAFELRPVVGPVLAELEARVAVVAPEEVPENADPEHVRGLVAMAAGAEASMREIAVEEATLLGDACISTLAGIARDPEADADERAAAVELLGALDTLASAGVLLELAEGAAEGWLRALAAWRLGETDQDWVVPRLLLRLKYEENHDAATWIARTLARFGNFAGLEALGAVQTGARDEGLRASAAARMAEIAADAGFPDAASLWEAWRTGADHAAFRPARSPRFQLEVWRLVAGFDAFQLRGVDDGRFVLERLGPPTAELVAPALHDESVYVRVNTAQGLERMGPRAAPAGPTLLAALADPDLGPNAAAALGALAFPPGEPALVACLGPDVEPSLRLAAARALGGYADAARENTSEALRALLRTGTDDELLQAAAESLVALGHGGEVAALLVPYLTSPRVEPITTERALRAWLAAEADGGNDEARETLAAWDALVIPSDRIVPVAEREASRRERRRLLEERLRTILGHEDS